MKLWKSIHKGPVAQIALSNRTTLDKMASGGSDGTVRLWNLEHHACTHNLKGLQGVVRYILYNILYIIYNILLDFHLCILVLMVAFFIYI